MNTKREIYLAGLHDHECAVWGAAYAQEFARARLEATQEEVRLSIASRAVEVADRAVVALRQVLDAEVDPDTDVGRGDATRGIACGGKHPPPACDDPRCWVARPQAWQGSWPSGHAPVTNDVTNIVGCTCGWWTLHGTTDSDDEFILHITWVRAQRAP